jgi:hypothetical protein
MEFIVRIEARLAGRTVKTCEVLTIARPGVVLGEERANQTVGGDFLDLTAASTA